MPVIPYAKHKLAEPGTSWDGPREVAAAEVSDLKVMCTWYGGSGKNKGDYKLPHHRASDHATVLAGVRSAWRLRNHADVPDGDRSGIESHLRRHLKEFGVDVDDSEAEQAAYMPGQACLQVEVVGGEPDVGLTREYEVLAITAGQGNGLTYGPEALEGALRLFEGVSVFVDHAQLPEIWSATGGRSLKNLLGVLHSVSFDRGVQGVRGTLTVYPGPTSEWFIPMLDEYLAGKARGEAVPRVGLSAVLDVKVRGSEVVAIDRVVSVDAVFDPARGGEFIRALNQRAQASGRTRDEEANEVEEEAQYVVDEALAEAQPTPGPAPEPVNPAPVQRSPAQAMADQPAGVTLSVRPGRTSAEIAAEQRVALAEMVLEARLAAVQLPDPMKELLRQQFGGRVFDLQQLDGNIERMQSAWAASVASQGPVVRGVGASRIEVGMTEVDRLQAVMDRLCGLPVESEALAAVPRVSGIRELYLLATGDYDFHGVFDPEHVHLANVTTSTMTSLVKNAFNKVVLDYFNTVERWWDPIASHEDFQSMQDLTLITLGGFIDLPTVSEGAAYTELSWSDAEEVVSFVKKGAYVGVTLEMMDKDETRKFRAIPKKIAMSGYRTLGTSVSALFTDNSGVGPYWPASQSTYRLFDSNYGNLGSSALTASTWDAAIQAMYEQAEETSSAVMGIRPSFLVVPIELEKTALTIMQSAGEPGTADNDANVRQGSSRVIVCPLWTNASNWAAVADPRMYPGIVIGYRYGRQPEIFIAGEETIGSMFTNDEMRVKARFIYAVGVGDYRPLYKANVS